jgi:hypothetical protein
MATQTISTTSDIPAILQDFYLGTGTGTDRKAGLLERGVSEIFPGGVTGEDAYRLRYADLINQGLTGEGAVAGLSDSQIQLGRDIESLSVPGAFGEARQYGQNAAAGLSALQNLQAMGVSAPELLQYQMTAPDLFGQQQAQQYMSPYMQSVVDVQQRKAVDAARQAQLGANLGAARAGTFGGSRQAVLQGIREAGLRQEMGDLQATGLQRAFENAQQQFERDRAAQFNVGKENLAAALGVQTLGAGQSLEAQRANQTAQLEAARQRGLAATGLGNLAQTMGGLGTQQLAGELDIIKTRGAFGDLERAVEQQRIDAQRRDLTEKADYGMTQVGQLSNLLRGIPLSGSTSTTTTPPPSFASQLTGLGLTGIGLYNLLGGGKSS